jgi:hypothetical protein
MPAAKKPALDLTAEAAAEGPVTTTEVVQLAPVPNRPAVTPIQYVGMIPLLAEFGHAFGIFDLSQAQQDSLSKLVLGSIALFSADAVIRVGRNVAHALHR